MMSSVARPRAMSVKSSVRLQQSYLLKPVIASSRCAFRRQAPLRRQSIVRAEQKENGKDSKADKEVSKLVKGLDKNTAQQILQVWEKSGAESPDQLRKLLIKRSVQSAGAVLVQTVLDAGASWGGFSTASYLSAGGDFPGKIIVQYLAYFLGLYFAAGVFLDLFLLGATTFAGVNYSTNAEAFQKAVRQVAGQSSGINVVDKAQSAVNTVKIINALNEISDILKKRVQAETSQADTLNNLTVYLTLQKAEQKGFKAEKYGLSGDQAAEYAVVFSKYDSNDDMVLEASEIGSLLSQEGFNFENREVKEAVKLLDKNGDGLISFEEFVEWAQTKLDPAKEPAKAA
ncbi:hypothetical protein CVIRNUC_004904 [Coccomyxa viridis]|uniref:EF-hand domain-containing protein n=1 Tax=Coccomyxa viridis TaxID=1274662 RepID=A0AAV1I2Z9_9CHLO|nr:hypothetical protein CVIRNUC_004904 [Coccomyxa viridis]